MYYFNNKLNSRYNFIIGQREYGRYYEETKNLLIRLGFNFTTKGIMYWIDALLIFKNNAWRYGFTMEFIYNLIAEKYNTTRDIVERNMRTTSNTAKNKIREIYKYTGKLTNKSILTILA